MTNLVHRLTSMAIFGLAMILPAGLMAQEQSTENNNVLTLTTAVLQAVQSSPSVILAQKTVSYKDAQVRIDRGEQDIAIGSSVSFAHDDVPFNPYYESYYGQSSQMSEALTTSVTMENELNNGITLGATLALVRDTDDVNDYPADNYSSVSFEITLPLLELWEKKGAAREKESVVDLTASKKELVFTVSQSIQEVAVNFWSALAQKQMLENHKKVEADTRTFLEKMTMLVQKNEYPAANLDRIKAELDAKTVSRIAAELSYFKAVQVLAVSIGTDAKNLSALTQVAGSFPEIKKTEIDTEAFIHFALDHRQDLAAGKVKEAYYNVLIRKAKENLLPELDLNLKAGYQGLDESSDGSAYLSSLSSNVPGPTYSVTLTYTTYLGNNAANGALQQAKIMLEKEQVINSTLERSIISEILTASQSYRQSVQSLESQIDAVDKFKTVLERERLSFSLQMSTLTDLMDARDDYYNSLNAMVSRQMAYAQSLVNLKQACGNLVKLEGATYKVDAATLLDPELTL